jgi:hypothetical protein
MKLTLPFYAVGIRVLRWNFDFRLSFRTILSTMTNVLRERIREARASSSTIFIEVIVELAARRYRHSSRNRRNRERLVNAGKCEGSDFVGSLLDEGDDNKYEKYRSRPQRRAA